MTEVRSAWKASQPLAWLAGIWMAQGAAAIGYLILIAKISRIGLLMHLALLLALLDLCILPWTFQAIQRLPFKRKRAYLAGILTVANFVLLLFYALLIFCHHYWGATPNLELFEVFAAQLGAFLPVLRVQFTCALLVLAALLLSIFFLYYRASPALLAAVERVASPNAPAAGAGRTTVPWRTSLLLLLGALVVLYLPTRNDWSDREPFHAFFGEIPFITEMMPEGMRRIQALGTSSYLQSLPEAPKPAKPRNLVLITVDALRSDQMGIYGTKLEDTPFLWSLYETGKLRRIDSAYSVCTFSFCGMLGIMSSAYWHQLNGSTLGLADLLNRYGYQVRFLLSGDNTHFYGMRRFFGSHIDEYRDGSSAEPGATNDDRIVLPWIREMQWSSSRPSFLEVHLMSVHATGLRQPQFEHWLPDHSSSTTLMDGTPAAEIYRNHYLNGVLQADDTIRKIFQILREKGVLDHALVIITADHGEYLGEFGRLGHGHEPYEPAARIPLLIYDPSPTDYPDKTFTSQVDIAPTFLAAIGVPVPPQWAGIPLQDPGAHQAISVDSYEVSGVVAQLGGRRYKYLHGRYDSHEELYDLSQAEGESNNLAGHPEAYSVLEAMRRLHQRLLLQNGTDSSLNRSNDERR